MGNKESLNTSWMLGMLISFFFQKSIIILKKSIFSIMEFGRRYLAATRAIMKRARSNPPAPSGRTVADRVEGRQHTKSSHRWLVSAAQRNDVS